MYGRSLYTDRIFKYLSTPVVKVITGMRRVGKSYFLKLIIAHLKEKGIDDEHIVYIDMESLEFEFITDYQILNSYIQKQTEAATGLVRVFIDEIQEVEGWEKCITSLLGSEKFDIFITGSNASLLSSELATQLSGRYIEFPIYSLGFDEFLTFTESRSESLTEVFLKYLKFGGFPALPHFDFDQEVAYQYINSLYNTILLKDVVKRHNVRNVTLLENITRYAFDNIGNIFSAKKISDYLKSQRMSIGVETVQNYLAYICSTFALYKVQRFDIKGKRILELHEKYFLGDIGLRHALLGYREADISGILENIVFLELKRQDYQVFIGKLGQYEVDFVATKNNKKIYIQVCYLLASKETIEREFRPLRAINDNYPKYVVSMDTLPGSDDEGIIRLNIVDFLLGFYKSS